jgi:ferredoxin-NADP reductase
MLTATLHDIVHVTPRSLLLRVEPHTPMAFAPGQAAVIGEHGLDQRRPYSIAVGPSEAARNRRLELLVGIGSDGSPGPHLPAPAPGLVLDLEGPFGTFTFPHAPTERTFLFVAGGTGIAPLRAMLHEALEADRGWGLHVLYSARTVDEFAFDEELTGLAASGRIRYLKTVTRDTVEPSWDGARGRISRAQLGAVVDDADTLCFVCGPAALVHDVPRLLLEVGIPRERIRVEEWAVTRVGG